MAEFLEKLAFNSVDVIIYYFFQFKRIGGILADELPVDQASLHAAIMAINNALDSSDHWATLKGILVNFNT